MRTVGWSFQKVKLKKVALDGTVTEKEFENVPVFGAMDNGVLTVTVFGALPRKMIGNFEEIAQIMGESLTRKTKKKSISKARTKAKV